MNKISVLVTMAITFMVLLPLGLNAQAPDTIWTRSYIGAADSTNHEVSAYACAIDKLGNLFVVGHIYLNTSRDYLILKYNSDGEILWSRTYNGQANSDDMAYACAVDDTGNLYVTGESYNGINYDYLTIKYDTTGDTLRTCRYNGPANNRDGAYGCAIDDSGNIYVTGHSFSGINDDYLTIKYTADLDSLWTSSYNGPANGSDWANACAIDNSGNLIVTGYSDNSSGTDHLTIKYNYAGDTLWTRSTYGLPNSFDNPSGCAVDDFDNIFITGYYFFNGINTACLTIKYNSSGDSLWSSNYECPSGNEAMAVACALDRIGNLYVTGYLFDGMFCDYLTIKYNPDGDTFWTCRYGGLWVDRAYGCCVDSLGNLFVTGGTSDDGANSAAFTIKYNTTTGIAGKPETQITSDKLRLEQNKPNPFGRNTIISYQLPASGPTNLKIYNITGQLVKIFDMGLQQPGYHHVEWRDSKIPAGVYFYRLTAGNYQATKKLVVIK